MNKVYNSQENFATNIKKFLQEVFPNIRKTQLKIIPYILLGMILAESIVASDIAKKLKNDFPLFNMIQLLKELEDFFSINYLNPMIFMMLSLNILLANINYLIQIIMFILYLIICFHMIIILYLCLL